MICAAVSDRVVPLRLRRSDNEAEGKMVLSALHTGEKEETVASYKHKRMNIVHFVTYCTGL